jgi:hypothetical protein
VISVTRFITFAIVLVNSVQLPVIIHNYRYKHIYRNIHIIYNVSSYCDAAALKLRAVGEMKLEVAGIVRDSHLESCEERRSRNH